MIAYVRAGERILALRQYQACRKLLRERLGVEPSSETTTLYTTLL
jgi:DNA-binding SARP family transcriptional activator